MTTVIPVIAVTLPRAKGAAEHAGRKHVRQGLRRALRALMKRQLKTYDAVIAAVGDDKAKAGFETVFFNHLVLLRRLDRAAQRVQAGAGMSAFMGRIPLASGST